MIKSVGIIGSGPSGACLASLLTLKGAEVTIFDDGKRPELVVGESLIPAVVPVLRRLGIEERAAAFCQHKPGATFTLNATEKIEFCFESLAGTTMPTYAYNAPRNQFDALLNLRADELGAKRAPVRAVVEREGDRLRLAAETLAEAPWLRGKQPDLIVDASGRNRLFARTMEIPSKTGPRKDAAYFAHFSGFDEIVPNGQVVIGRLEEGWSWRIPLPDRLSVGVVLNKDAAAKLGATPEERLEGAIARDPLLSAAGKGRKRLTNVFTYTNYQLISDRGYGPGWAMVGDAFGFVDPMLSPGVHLALYSAQLLADHLENPEEYSRKLRHEIQAWMGLIRYFYDGRMFAMYQSGTRFERRFPGRITQALHKFFNDRVAGMASGGYITSRFGHGMLETMAHPAAWMTNPATLAIR